MSEMSISISAETGGDESRERVSWCWSEESGFRGGCCSSEGGVLSVGNNDEVLLRLCLGKPLPGILEECPSPVDESGRSDVGQ